MGCEGRDEAGWEGVVVMPGRVGGKGEGEGERGREGEGEGGGVTAREGAKGEGKRGNGTATVSSFQERKESATEQSRRCVQGRDLDMIRSSTGLRGQGTMCHPDGRSMEQEESGNRTREKGTERVRGREREIKRERRMYSGIQVCGQSRYRTTDHRGKRESSSNLYLFWLQKKKKKR